MWMCWGPLFRTTACLSTSRIYCERPPQLMCVFSFFSVKENHCSQEWSLNTLSIYKIYSTEISVKHYTIYKRVWTFTFLRSFRKWNFQRDIYRKIGKNSKSFFLSSLSIYNSTEKKSWSIYNGRSSAVVVRVVSYMSEQTLGIDKRLMLFKAQTASIPFLLSLFIFICMRLSIL